ncbi:hypothetical protein EYE40_12130 [Glaciihabitans arcticus]|uniref:Uncharacterized protein n=1 Tax=Glaciihabitans arcticus TaxID=2668039 RepID=A0A4Q9GTN0_9MICO|nr:hypothetical protein [Glaciihabitans arcticus]TBN58081.1 hypothetical protein EYE40_12130 [Glaciihabitans arcticus]
MPGTHPATTTGYIISTYDISPDDVSTLLERFTVVPAATRSGGIPATGWARLAMALHPLHGSSDVLVIADLADGTSIVIDWGRKDYWRHGGTGLFPVEATMTNVRIYRAPGARLPFLVEKPDDLSTLLWYVGFHAFPDATAWWFADDCRYQLSRWPDFTSLEHDPDHVRMTALLGSGTYTAQELGQAAGVSPVAAQRLLNALGLMGLLRETPVLAGAPVVPTTERSRGLFGRLRARLGLI